MNSGPVAPRPWRLELYGDGEDEEVWGILDANGAHVVKTDCGYYPPNKVTAQFIIDAVNSYVAPLPRPE